MSKKRAKTTQGFSAVKTHADLVDQVGEGTLPQGFQLEPLVELTLNALKSFLQKFAAQLSAADWIVKIRATHEKARYLLVYDILKQFLLLERGRRLHLEQASVAEIRDSEQDLFFAFEERLGAETEFVVTHGHERGPIQMVVEVKTKLSPQTVADESTWQFYAELLTACQYNLSLDNAPEESEVYGCLTDAYVWYFYRAVKSANAWSITAAEEVILFQPTAKATNSTATAINLFFSALLPDMKHATDGIHTAQHKCDEFLESRASKFVRDTLDVKILQAELAEERVKVAQRDQQIAELQAQLQHRSD